MSGFFKSTGISKPKVLGLSAPACGACGLYKGCQNPKQGVYGEGRMGILLVDGSPSYDGPLEEPFGKHRSEITKLLRRLDISLHKDCWFMSSIACATKNDSPTAEQVRHCGPLYSSGLASISPHVVITFGYSAAIAAIGDSFPASSYKVDAWYGWQIPDQQRNFWICPTYQVSTLGKENDPLAQMMKKFLEEHVEEALKFKKRPWESTPQWIDEVKVAHSDTEGAAAVIEFLAKAEAGGQAIAFDIEANMLKPDPVGAEIVCISFCRGVRTPVETLAVPWGPKVKEATLAVMRSDCPKLGANIKFENRWMIREYGEGARNWQWDAVTNGHILDNRDNVSSVKFQSYALLGQPDYSSHMHQFFTSDGTMTPNRINQVKRSTLLSYCGMDSLLEFRLAIRQAKLLNYPLPWINNEQKR